jgi:hypothetical protein
MKALAIALPLTLGAGVLIGVQSATPWFGPRAADLQTYAGTTGPVASGSSFVVATVPASTHLVLSEASVATLPIGNGNYPFGWSLVQRDASGTEVVKYPTANFMGLGGIVQSSPGRAMLPSIDGVGLVFDPGTDVVLKYTDPVGGGYAPTVNGTYVMVGHYAER